MPLTPEFVLQLAQAGGLILIAVPTVFLLFKYFYTKIELKHLISKSGNLRTHVFFENIDYHLDYKIPRLQFKCEYRKRIFRKLLRIKFKHWKESMYTLIDMTFIDNDDLRKKCLQEMAKCVNSYEEEWKKAGIPKVVIAKFAEWHYNKIELVRDTIPLIASSNLFTNQKEKLADILNLYTTLLTFTILDAEKSLRDLNGELDSWVEDQKEFQPDSFNNFI